MKIYASLRHISVVVRGEIYRAAAAVKKGERASESRAMEKLRNFILW